MTFRNLVALVLLSLPVATGCVVEVDDAELGDPALREPAAAVDGEEQWAAELGADDVAEDESSRFGAQDAEDEWIQPAGFTERADPDPTPWHLRADPVPDPWIGEPDD